MILTQIYERFNRGSPGFVRAIQSTRVYDMSPDEIRRLALASPTAEEFDRGFLLRAWWRDDYEPRMRQALVSEDLWGE